MDYAKRVTATDDQIRSLVLKHIQMRSNLGEKVIATEYRGLADWVEDYAANVLTKRQNDQTSICADTQNQEKPADATDEFATLLGPSESKSIGRYRIGHKLGAGGMGSVYQAFDTVLDRNVAFKIPHFSNTDSKDIVDRFHREAKAMAMLCHPNLCQVFDVGQSDGIHYLTMALIRGRSLTETIKSGEMSLPLALNITRSVALALHEAHKAGVVHRDLKPANIMIDEGCNPIVIDFGLARGLVSNDLTGDGAIVGTPAYMSPEQTRGEHNEVGPSSDIFSLGVVLYLMLTSRLPFDGAGLSVLAQIQRDAPIPPRTLAPTIPVVVEQLCLKCLAKEKHNRYLTMVELAHAIDGLVISSQVASRTFLQEEARRTLSVDKKFDIFISFAPADDQPHPNSSSGWVANLIQDLTWRLCQLNGRTDEISFAVSHDPIHEASDNSSSRFDDSALLLLINSPGYQNAVWRREEMRSMRELCRKQKDQVIVVERDKLIDRLEDFPKDLSLRFWSESPENGVSILDRFSEDISNKQRYFAKLDDLARKIYALLRRSPTAPVESQTSSRQESNDKKNTSHLRTSETVVFLAEVTDDIDSERTEIQRYLEQAGYRIVPQTWLPRDHSEFCTSVDEALRQSVVFVQLLSSVSGRKPPGVSESYAALQAKRATGMNKPILQWRNTSIRPDSIADLSHRLLIAGPNVQSVALADFKREVHNYVAVIVQKRQSIESGVNHSREDQPFIFINVEPTDCRDVVKLCELFEQSGYAYALPLSTGRPDEIMQDLEANLIDCDGLVIVYGDIPGQWVREQLRLWRRILHRREKPLQALAIYEGAPDPKIPLGMTLPKMQILDCRHGMEQEKIRQFIDIFRSGHQSQ